MEPYDCSFCVRCAQRALEALQVAQRRKLTLHGAHGKLFSCHPPSKPQDWPLDGLRVAKVGGSHSRSPVPLTPTSAKSLALKVSAHLAWCNGRFHANDKLGLSNFLMRAGLLLFVLLFCLFFFRSLVRVGPCQQPDANIRRHGILRVWITGALKGVKRKYGSRVEPAH